MQVQSSISQPNALDEVTAAQSSGQSTQPPDLPTVFDTTDAESNRHPAWATESSNAPPSPSPVDNYGTCWKLGPNGEHIYEGRFEVHRPPHDTSQDRTLGDVFLTGFKDGATQPGQTIGKIVDIAKGNGNPGDSAGPGEKAGKEFDDVAKQLPVVGTAYTITGGMAGKRNADGTPQLPTPDVQPDASEAIRPGAARKTLTPATDEVRSNPAPERAMPLDVPATYAVTPRRNLQADSSSPGIFRDEKGQTYIQAADQNWPVRYDKDNATWRAYQPNDPAKPQYPVSLDERGNWQIHDNVGLKGGTPDQATGGGNTVSNRDRLADEVRNSPTGNDPGSYPSSVKIVNDLLQRFKIDLSDSSVDTIVNNLQTVNAGEIAHASASAREVWTFARDVADSSQPMKERVAAALGMVANGIVAPAYMTEFDLQNYHFGRNQSEDLRRAMQMFMQFDGHA